MIKFFLSIVFLVSISGCWTQFQTKLYEIYEKQLAPLLGIKIEKKVEIKPETTPDQVNAETIRELFKIVLLRPVRDSDEFTRFFNVLSQEGHIEGIYNGIIYSEEYKGKEVGTALASAVKLYTNVMVQLILDQKYDPLKIKKPDEPPAVPGTSTETAALQPTLQERADLFTKIEQESFALSLFTMKRRLGEEVLKTVDLKKEYREKMATWFGRFASFMNNKGIDYGAEPRNNPNEYFHYKWALEVSEDRLKWECLNRVHMLLNSAK